jgi:phosphate transport system substrate-binding protein
MQTIVLLASIALSAPISVKGSDTMVILGQRWAEDFMKTHPGSQIQVTGGGSGTGISALINGTTDICQSSREMKPAEKDKLKEKYKTTGVEIPVAKDGVTIYVHVSNPIEALTIDQLKQIYTGKITNWRDVGGPDKKIIPYSRENSSGTYVFFKEEVLGGADFAASAQTLPGTAAVVNAVAKEKNSIGYGGAAYAKNIKLLKIKKDASSAAVDPDKASVQSGTYPLARPLFFYLRDKPSGDVGAFIDWVLSPAGQSLAETVGYFPIK